MLAWLAAISLGMLIGSAATTLHVGRRLDALMFQRAALEQQVRELTARVLSLQDSLAQRRRRPLRSIDVQLVGLDATEEVELRRQMQELLATLLGREVEQVDPDIVGRMVDGRLFTVHGRTMRAEVRRIWITDALTLWVEVKAAASPPAPR